MPQATETLDLVVDEPKHHKATEKKEDNDLLKDVQIKEEELDVEDFLLGDGDTK